MFKTVLYYHSSIFVKQELGEKEKRVSRAAHGFGALTGLLLGVFILKNRVKSEGENKYRIGAFVLFLIMVAILCLWHIFGGSMEEDSWFNPKDAKSNGIDNCSEDSS